MDFIYFYSTKTRMENLVKRELLTLDINIDKNIWNEIHKNKTKISLERITMWKKNMSGII